MRNALLPVIILCIACIFLFAAIGKIRSFQIFQNNLNSTFGVPDYWTKLLSLVLIGVELLLALGLFLTNHFIILQLGLTIACVLFLVFNIVIVYQFISKDLVRCSCFGEEERPVSNLDILRNCLLLCFTLYAGLAIEPSMIWPSTGLTLVLQFGSGLTLSVLMMHFHDLSSAFLRELDN